MPRLARRRRLVLMLIALAAVPLHQTGAADPAGARSTPVGVGDVAPDFTLLDQDGRSHTLSAALATQDAAVLIFYRGHW